MANAVKGTKGFKTIPLQDRFWPKVDRSGGDDACWPWLGTVHSDKFPYGSIWADGRVRRATQVSWEIANGKPFPAGMQACHSCDNPRCVNPKHLWPGTQRDNTIDAYSKGLIRVTGRPVRPPKTHCNHGHEFTPENTVRHKTGRECRLCKQLADARRWAADRADREARGETVKNRPDSYGVVRRAALNGGNHD